MFKPSVSWLSPSTWPRIILSKVPPLVLVIIAAGVFWHLPHGTVFGGTSVKGYAEVISHPVAPIAGGRLDAVNVAVGQHVKAGDVVASMSRRTLEANRETLLAQLTQAEAVVLAEIEAQDANVTRGELWVMRARAMERGDRAELKQLSSQVARLGALAADRMISATEAEDRARRQQALAARVETYDHAIAAGQFGFRRSSKAGGHGASVDIRVAPSRAAVQIAEAQLHEVEQAIEDTALRAPCDGIVSAVVRRGGEVASTGDEIVTVISTRPGVVIAYVPERLSDKVILGMAATVHRDTFLSKPLRGKVFEISPVVEEAPVRTRPSPAIPVWGRKVAVVLEPPIDLLPGEAFHVQF